MVLFGTKGVYTLTVLRTEIRRGKSDTPVASVSTEDSRKEREVRSEVTQSPYVDRFGLVMAAGFGGGRIAV